MSTPFTLMDYHQRITEFITLMLASDPSKVATLEALGGKPFDIHNMTIPDLGYKMLLDGVTHINTIEDVYWEVGDWRYTFYMEEAHSWVLKNTPDAVELNVSVTHKDQWAARCDFTFSWGHTPMQLDTEDLSMFVYRTIDAPKRRIGITIREAEKYLANQAYYDTLKSVLNIKPRKKK